MRGRYIRVTSTTRIGRDGLEFGVAVGCWLTERTSLSFGFEHLSLSTATHIAGGVTIGRIAIRGGIAMSPEKFAESIAGGSGQPRT